MQNIILHLVLIYQNGARSRNKKSTISGRKRHPIDPRMLFIELKQLVRKYIAHHEKAEIVCLAEAARHKVLHTPPYYSNSQLS